MCNFFRGAGVQERRRKIAEIVMRLARIWNFCVTFAVSFVRRVLFVVSLVFFVHRVSVTCFASTGIWPYRVILVWPFIILVGSYIFLAPQFFEIWLQSAEGREAQAPPFGIL